MPATAVAKGIADDIWNPLETAGIVRRYGTSGKRVAAHLFQLINP